LIFYNQLKGGLKFEHKHRLITAGVDELSPATWQSIYSNQSFHNKTSVTADLVQGIYSASEQAASILFLNDL